MNYIKSRQLFTFILLLLGVNLINAQDLIDFRIENQEVNANSLHFDIYAKSSEGTNFHLGNADLILQFNAEYFNNPTLEKVNAPEKSTLLTTKLSNRTSTSTK